MPTATEQVGRLEEKIRNIVLSRRVRVTEYFKDYDKLRSGYITSSRFKRCLDLNVQLGLNPSEVDLLVKKYEDKNDGNVNYRQFCVSIDGAFEANDLRVNPEAQKVEPINYLGTEISKKSVDTSLEAHTTFIIEHMVIYYKYHGINFRTCFQDFDRYHIGLVTENQFYRSFPGPSDISEEDLKLLARRYEDPKQPGQINYLNLHHDILTVMAGMETKFENGDPPSTGYNIPRKPALDEALDAVFNKIQLAVYKNGIRVKEFFKDFDKLRSGIITENQFVCGLALAVGKEAQLSRADIQKMATYYKQPDGRINYTHFCFAMDNIFNEPHLEKTPTREVYRPPLGALSRTLNPISQEEEEKLEQILNQLREIVQKKRVLAYPTFKDFDRSRAYTRNVTFTQFGRILHFLNLNVQPEEFKLLCRRFEDPSMHGDVNYPAFVQAIDKEFIGFTKDNEFILGPEKPPSPLKVVDTSGVNLDELIGRIRHHVLVNRLRVIEFFQDFDPLRSGSITANRFRMSLMVMGQNLKDPDFLALSTQYRDPSKADPHVLWQKFMEDIETVFTQKDLERMPTYEVPSTETFLMERPGTLDWQASDKSSQEVAAEVMDRMRQRIDQRRVLTKPCFQDFDRHNRGYVTRSQFKQCLTYLSLSVTKQEMDTLEEKFSDNFGFNYLKFLEELQPSAIGEQKYHQRLEELKLVNSREVNLEKKAFGDIEGVMKKIRDKVVRERIRILEFLKDYDKLRTGCMKKENFRRALDPANLGLKASEVTILENYYEKASDPGYVEYLAFSDDVESIFTVKELEKMPLYTPSQYKPPSEVELNKLPENTESVLKNVMNKIAERVRIRRMQLFPLFEDFNRVKNGAITRSQFKRVLSELELGSLASELEFYLLCERFRVNVGDRDDVDYNTFCDAVYDLAKFEWRKP